MTFAISQLVYMPNFRAIGQSVWEKNGNRQKHRNTNTHLNFIKILAESTRFHGYKQFLKGKKLAFIKKDFFLPRAACPALGIEIQKSGSAMTSAISQLVYMPNFRAIGQSIWEKNGNRQTDRKTERQT